MIPLSKFLLKTGWVILLSCFFGFLLIACGATGTSQTQTTSTPASAFHASTKTSDGMFLLQFNVTPDQLGTNTFTVSVDTAHTGKAATNLTVQLTTTMLDMDMGTDTVTLQSTGNGHYSAQGELEMDGNWEIGVQVRTPDSTLHEAKVKLHTQ